jgi:phage tail sheath gpL-like
VRTLANDIFIEIEGEEAGITFVVTQLTSGAVNPDIDDALGLIGPTWETIICNCLNYDDTDTLDKLSVVGEARWNQQVKTPLRMQDQRIE